MSLSAAAITSAGRFDCGGWCGVDQNIRRSIQAQQERKKGHAYVSAYVGIGMAGMEELLTLLFNALLLVFVVKLLLALFNTKIIVILLYILVLLFAMLLSGRFPG